MTTLDFHPTVSVLASGSKDCTVKLFDYSKPSAKRAYRVVQDVAPVRCLCFHPTGEFMIVGTEQSTRQYCSSILIMFITCTRTITCTLTCTYSLVRSPTHSMYAYCNRLMCTLYSTCSIKKATHSDVYGVVAHVFSPDISRWGHDAYTVLGSPCNRIILIVLSFGSYIVCTYLNMCM